MEIPESTYYYKPKDKLERKKRDADISDAIKAILPAISLRTDIEELQQP